MSSKIVLVKLAWVPVVPTLVNSLTTRPVGGDQRRLQVGVDRVGDVQAQRDA